MSDKRTLDLIYLLSQLQLKRSWREDPVPENLNELKAVKKRLLKETFGQIEKAFLIKALKACRGNISRSAERVGMQRANFSALLKKHNLSASEFKN
jgi:two-component system NtrC family response regulator